MKHQHSQFAKHMKTRHMSDENLVNQVVRPRQDNGSADKHDASGRSASHNVSRVTRAEGL